MGCTSTKTKILAIEINAIDNRTCFEKTYITSWTAFNPQPFWHIGIFGFKAVQPRFWVVLPTAMNRGSLISLMWTHNVLRVYAQRPMRVLRCKTRILRYKYKPGIHWWCFKWRRVFDTFISFWVKLEIPEFKIMSTKLTLFL